MSAKWLANSQLRSSIKCRHTVMSLSSKNNDNEIVIRVNGWRTSQIAFDFRMRSMGCVGWWCLLYPNQKRGFRGAWMNEELCCWILRGLFFFRLFHFGLEKYNFTMILSEYVTKTNYIFSKNNFIILPTT